MNADEALRATPEGAIGGALGIFAGLAFCAAIALIICKLFKASPLTSYLTAAALSLFVAAAQLTLGDTLPLAIWLILAAALFWGYKRSLRRANGTN